MASLIYSNDAKIAYCVRLYRQIHKILFLSEENNNIVPSINLHALIIDVNSANNMFDNIFIDVSVKLNTLYMLSSQTLTHSEIRSRVLECANMVDRIRKELSSDGKSS
jgi:hypothetical protein